MWFAPLFLCSNILRAWAVLSILSFLLPSSDLIHSRKICQAPLACSDTRHKLNFISWNSGTKASEKDNHDKHSRHTYLSAQQAAIIIYTCSSYQSSDIQTKIFQRLTFWKCCKPIPTIIIWKYIIQRKISCNELHGPPVLISESKLFQKCWHIENKHTQNF